MKFLKRISHGLDVSANYTFSKTENVGGYINADPSIRKLQKGLDASYYPDIFVTAITYTTPRVTSNKLVRAVLGDWTWGSTLRYAEWKSDRGSAIAAQQVGHLYVRFGDSDDEGSGRAAVPDRYQLPLHRSE